MTKAGKTHKTDVGTGEEWSGRGALRSAWDAPVNSLTFKKENKIPAQGFCKAWHACVCVYAYSQWAELLVSHMAAPKSLSSTLNLQKKIPLCLTHILFLYTAHAINISHQTHCSSSKHTEFPLTLTVHGRMWSALFTLRQPFAHLPLMSSSKGAAQSSFKEKDTWWAILESWNIYPRAYALLLDVK